MLVINYRNKTEEWGGDEIHFKDILKPLIFKEIKAALERATWPGGSHGPGLRGG